MGNDGETGGSSVGSGPVIRFGPFLVDGGRRQVTRDGSAVHLTPKAFDLLVLLASHAPRVLTKTQLHERLWPSTYVSDATLVGLIKELRRALGDTDPARPIIRTAHRVGYAFSAAIDADVEDRPAMPSHWLVLRGRRIGLRGGENLVGRDPAADVWLDVAGVSRRHARILVEADGVRLEDLGSKNGTTADARGVESVVTLRDGHRLAFGPVEAVYRCSGAGMSTETQGVTGHPVRPSPR